MAYFDPAGARGWLVAIREPEPATLRKAGSRRILCPACETSVAIPQRVAELEFTYRPYDWKSAEAGPGSAQQRRPKCSKHQSPRSPVPCVPAATVGEQLPASNKPLNTRGFAKTRRAMKARPTVVRSARCRSGSTITGGTTRRNGQHQ